ncbi:MAG: transglycosylase SLT domain-containing protein [Pseudomonadota bacterium]
MAVLLLMLVHWADLAQRYPPPSRLDRVQHSGTLRVAVPVDPGIDHAAFQDLHHALLREFANRLDVTVSLVEAESQARMLELLVRDEVDLAVPARPLPPDLPRHFYVGPGYVDSQTHVVCNSRAHASRALQRLVDQRDVRVSASDGYLARLAAAGNPRIRLVPQAAAGTASLLESVAAGDVECTFAQADEISRARQRLPNLHPGEAVGPAGSVGWVLRNTRDGSLIGQVDRFFLHARKSGLLAQLRQQDRGLTRRFEVVDFDGFRLALATKLPRFEAAFRSAGAQYGIDWRLLAALAYQESRWNPHAESPHGAGGMMMLVADTARAMGCRNRFDAGDSILAAARYVATLRDSLANEVAEPHRTWMTLAAYNLGPQGLARARQRVAAQGGDPGRWPEVRRVLPTLQRGARAWEPVFHVESVRRYFALLSLDTVPTQRANIRITPRGGSAAGVAVDARSVSDRTRRSPQTG